MKAKPQLTAERLRELIHYDPDTGVFTRKVRPGVAGTAHRDGYVQLSVDGRLYLGQRLAWLYMTGYWPKHQVDHKDSVRSNNRWANLREATASQNLANRGRPSSNKSGAKGVSWSNRHNKWLAEITCQKKRQYLGLYDDIEDAARAYQDAAERHFGEFARVA